MDVDTENLNGNLEGNIQMMAPEDVTEIDRNSTICRIVNALYILKQQCRGWYTKIDSFFEKFGVYVVQVAHVSVSSGKMMETSWSLFIMSMTCSGL